MLSIALNRAALAAAGTLLTLGAATACVGGSEGDPGAGRAGGNRLDLVSAFYPLQFIAEQVGGDAVRVTNLVKPGAEPHDLELRPKQVAQVADADLVIYLKGFQPALDDAVRQEAASRTFDVATVTPLVDPAGDTDQHRPTGKTAAGAGQGSAASDRPGESKDPHLWLDPIRLAAVADELAARLAKIDSEHAAGYRDRAGRLRAKLQDLDREYANGLKTCQRRELVTSHAAFGYLADRYQLRQVAITGLSPEAEPPPGRLAAVAEQARQHQATTIFFETLVSPKVAQALAAEVGATTAVLDPIEGLRPGSTEDYLSVMRNNLATLRTALGCS